MIMSEAFSAIMMVGALVLPDVIVGTDDNKIKTLILVTHDQWRQIGLE